MAATNSSNDIVVMNMIKGHIADLRSIECYSRALFVVFMERNYGGFTYTSHLVEQIVEVPNVYPVEFESQDPRGMGRAGVWTSEAIKESYVRTARGAMLDENILFAEHFVTTPVTDADVAEIEPEKRAATRVEYQAEREKNIMSMFFDQLVGFVLSVKEPVTALGFYKSRYTGKGGGGKDDLVICFMMCLYWATVKRYDKHFRERAASNNRHLH